MKNLTVFCCCFTLIISANCQDYNSLDGKKLGLISYLTYIKTISEFKMTKLSTASEYRTSPKTAQFNSEYNLIKLSVDKLINQLCADLYTENRLKKYRIINSYIQGKSKKISNSYPNYEMIIKDIEQRLESFLVKSYSATLSAGEITGVIEQGISLIKESRDFREKKIHAITSLLNEFKLKPLSDLLPKCNNKSN